MFNKGLCSNFDTIMIIYRTYRYDIYKLIFFTYSKLNICLIFRKLTSNLLWNFCQNDLPDLSAIRLKFSFKELITTLQIWRNYRKEDDISFYFSNYYLSFPRITQCGENKTYSRTVLLNISYSFNSWSMFIKLKIFIQKRRFCSYIQPI